MVPPPTAPPNADMQVNAELLAQMASDMFVSMLEMHVEAIDFLPFETGAELMCASIRISGVWNAELHVVTTDSVAKGIACNMFAAEMDGVTTEDVQDALGEVVNVIGGNVKGVMDNDCNLSLPCVGEVPGDLPAGQTSQDVFCCDGRLRMILNVH